MGHETPAPHPVATTGDVGIDEVDDDVASDSDRAVTPIVTPLP